MGYETALHLVNIKIKEESRSVVEKAFKTKKRSKGFDPVKNFLACVVVDDLGFLCFKCDGESECFYVPDEDDGTVPALSGKWRKSEKIAEWLKL